MQSNEAEISITSLTVDSKRPGSGIHSSFKSPTKRFSKNTNSGFGNEKASRERISGLSFASAKSRMTTSGDSNTGTVSFFCF